MTITEAKEKLKNKRAEFNAFRRTSLKEIKELEKYIVDNGGMLDKIDNSKRNHQIYLDREAGKPVKELAATYKLSEDSIRRIHSYQEVKVYKRSK